MVFFKKVKPDFDRSYGRWRKQYLLADPYILKEVQSRYQTIREGFDLLRKSQSKVSVKDLVAWLDTTDLVASDAQIWKNVTLSKLPVKDELSKDNSSRR